VAVLAEKSLREALRHGIGRLREADIATYTLAAELLLLQVIGRERVWLYSHPEEQLASAQVEQYETLLERRIAGEPTQHLTGKQEFWGLEFEVTTDVLIPRPETEHLIEVALDRLAVRDVRAGRPRDFNGEGLRFIDVGTGSGCIAVALAKEFPGARIHATDISAAALEIARRNAARLVPYATIHFEQANLLDPFSYPVANHEQPRFDLVVSNPPYISRREAPTLAREVREHEPEAALYGGPEGYELYAPLILQAREVLKPNGILVVELGHDSLPAVQPLVDLPPWDRIAVTNDLAGIPRVLSAELL
jgi:release factor glutamine methyltransferase